MRLWKLILWDVKFLIKYGFILLYGLLTALYLIILLALPAAWRGMAAAIIIFSDPAALGLFFMGAIVLLEKSQRTPCALAVSPLKAREYVLSKSVALLLVTLLTSAVLGAAAGVRSLPLTLSGTALSAVIYSLLGIIAATRIKSLNQFVFLTAPVEIAGSVPAVLHLFGALPSFMRLYPTSVCMDMIAGEKFSVIGLVLAAALAAALFLAANKSVKKMWESEGGVKL